MAKEKKAPKTSREEKNQDAADIAAVEKILSDAADIAAAEKILSDPAEKPAPFKPTVLSLGDLKHDGRNARKHNPRNHGTIVDSIQKVGPARSIVIDENNMVLCGNATVDALGEAGIEQVRVIERDPNAIYAVRVSGLSEAQKRQLAIFDNKANDLSEFDATELIRQAEEYQFDLMSVGFNEAEIEKLAEDVLKQNPADQAEDPEQPATEEGGGLGTPIIRYDVIFDDEDQQKQWFHFLRYLKKQYPDDETIGARISKFLQTVPLEA